MVAFKNKKSVTEWDHTGKISRKIRITTYSSSEMTSAVSSIQSSTSRWLYFDFNWHVSKIDYLFLLALGGVLFVASVAIVIAAVAPAAAADVTDIGWGGGRTAHWGRRLETGVARGKRRRVHRVVLRVVLMVMMLLLLMLVVVLLLQVLLMDRRRPVRGCVWRRRRWRRVRMRLRTAATDAAVVVLRGLVVVRTSQPVPFRDLRVRVGSVDGRGRERVRGEWVKMELQVCINVWFII